MKELRPLFRGNWERVLFIHYQADPAILQRQIPFELDLWQGRALVSTVAFSMRRLRPVCGGRLLEALMKPIANHEFFNVRTYVRPNGRPGIYFMAEWVNNPLNWLLGPITYGLPYRFGRIAYQHGQKDGRLGGAVDSAFCYGGQIPADASFLPCAPGSLDEFLLERYSAFTHWHGIGRTFDISHEPWLQCPVELNVEDDLLKQTGGWFYSGQRIGANYSPGLDDVGMGAPRRCSRRCFC